MSYPPRFTRPVCGCERCPEWRRLEMAGWQLGLSERGRECETDPDGWLRLAGWERRVRFEYLAHLELRGLDVAATG